MKGQGTTRRSSASNPKAIGMKVENSQNKAVKAIGVKEKVEKKQASSKEFTKEAYDALNKIHKDTVRQHPTYTNEYDKRMIEKAAQQGYSKVAVEAYDWNRYYFGGTDSQFAKIRMTEQISKKDLLRVLVKRNTIVSNGLRIRQSSQEGKVWLDTWKGRSLPEGKIVSIDEALGKLKEKKFAYYDV